MYSVLEMIPYSKDQGASKKLLNIAKICKQQSLIVFADCLKDLEHLLDQNQGLVADILDTKFIESISTQKISSIKWPKGESYIAFTHPSCLITQAECQAKIKTSYIEKSKSPIFPKMTQDKAETKLK